MEKMLNKIKKITKKIIKSDKLNRDLTFLLLLTPIILYLIISNFKNIQNFFPNPTYGDETGYYRVTHSFVNSENFGNYGVSLDDDVSAKYGGFSAHGPKYTILYSIFAIFIGWYPYTILVCNILLLFIAMFALVHILNLNNKQLSLIIILFFTFFPFLYFYITGMVEVVQYFFFIIYSVILYKFLKKPNKRNFIINLIFIFLMTLFRINYMIFYIPVIYFYNTKKINKKLFLYLTLAFILILFSYYFIGIFSAPYPSYLSELISLLSSLKIWEFIKLITQHIFDTTKQFYSFKGLSVVEICFNYLFFIVMLINVIIGLFKRKNKKEINIYFLNFFIMFISFLIVITLYEVQIYKSLRVLSPILFLSILLLIYYEKYYSVIVQIIICFIITIFIIKYDTFINNAELTFTNQSLISDEISVKELNNVIICSESKDKWENTVAVPNSYSYSFNIMAGLKPCLGLNYILNEDYSKLDKVKYILVENDESINKNKYELILNNNLGKLYRKIEKEG